MNRMLTFLMLWAFVLAAPARASDESHGNGHGDGSSDASAEENMESGEAALTQGGHPMDGWGDSHPYPPNSVPMPMLLVPSVTEGRLSHHIFITYRLLVSSQLAVDRVNQKVAWLHDAFMRDIYDHNPTDPDNPNRPDLDAFEQQLVGVSKRLFHDNVVKGVFYIRVRSERDPPPVASSVVPKRHEKEARAQASGGH